jgi:hypothetical protein
VAVRLDAAVAVRLDTDSLLASVGPGLAASGRALLAGVRELGPDGGGAAALVDDAELGELSAWVGVVNGVLTGDCDCAAQGSGGSGGPDGSGELCGHAVAVALAALDAGLDFSSASSAPARDGGADHERYADLAAQLPAGQLVELVAGQAAADPEFAALLLARAGRPGGEPAR